MNECKPLIDGNIFAAAIGVPSRRPPVQEVAAMAQEFHGIEETALMLAAGMPY